MEHPGRRFAPPPGPRGAAIIWPSVLGGSGAGGSPPEAVISQWGGVGLSFTEEFQGDLEKIWGCQRILRGEDLCRISEPIGANPSLSFSTRRITIFYVACF